MYQIFEASDGSSDIESNNLAAQLNMAPEDLLALHMFSNDQLNFLKQKQLLIKNLNENQKFIDLFKRIYAIVKKYKRNSPEGDESL